MNEKKGCIAVDIGASSGKIVWSHVSNNTIEFKTIYRFENTPLKTEQGILWDIPALYNHIITGLCLPELEKLHPLSIGIDTWAVDYLILDAEGNCKTPAFSYRDERTTGIPEIVFKYITPYELYGKTGIQIQRFNTIFQLFEQKQRMSFSPGDSFMMIPDYLHYLLTGVRSNEVTNLSTTQCCEPGAAVLDSSLLSFTGLQKHNFPRLLRSGENIGFCSEKKVSHLSHITGMQVIAPATHDTASAVCAVPSDEGESLFISSGTWTLMGVELDLPVISEKAFKANFSNEAGHGGKTCLLKNIMGLWLLQRLQKELSQLLSFNEMEEIARASKEIFRSVIDPQDDCFLNPVSMKDAIADYCRLHGLQIPDTPQRLIRCVYDSLCLSFRNTLDEIRDITGKNFRRLYIIGGGCRDELLCQLTADMTGLEVYAGPSEATAVGNCIVQLIAQGKLSSLEEGRRILKDSIQIKKYYSNSSSYERLNKADLLISVSV